MSIFNLFSRLEELGINIQLQENNLKIDAPKGKLDQYLIAEIKDKKQEIIHFLQEYVRGYKNDDIIKPVEKKEYYELSSAQKRLYILQQMDRQGIEYNIPFGLELEGQVDKHRLERTLRRLVHRHESFRTSFEMKGDEPVQKIEEEVKVKVEEERSSRVEGTRGLAPLFIKEFIRPFDLSKAPLLRVGLMELEENQYILMIDMHHIAADGVSIEILTKEFMAVYAQDTDNLPRLKIQYKDYARWQNHERKQTGIKEQEEYWKKEFAIHEEIPVLNLPLDHPRPTVQSFTGRELKFELSSLETGALKKLAHEQEATLYMVLLSMYTIFLSKLSCQEDIIVGTPVAGRRYDRLRNIIGMFVNTLALRNFPGEEKTFTWYLSEVKDWAMAGFAHQDYPFEELVEAVARERDVGRNPLFDTLFVLQNVDIPAIEIPGISIKPYPLETGTSKFDLSLNALETEKNLEFRFEYSSTLFQENTIQRFTRYFKRIIASVLENKEIKLYQIEIIPAEEKKKILIDFNETRIDYPQNRTIHCLCEEQVERTPDNIALVVPQVKYRTHMTYMTYISYRELNERSDQLAYLLKEKGVLADRIVAIQVERSLEMIIGLLGILKAGGAYLPIGTDYPQERIDYMLKDSGAKILLTAQEIAGLYSPQALNNRPKGASIHLHLSPAPATSLSYIIYTSGTTGHPKGCMVSHQNVVSLLKNKIQAFDFNENDVWTMFHRYNFDFSVWEMYGALLYGGKLIIIPKQVTMNLESYLRLLKREQVTVLNQTPSAFYQLSGIEMSQPDRRLNLRYVIFGGEALSPVKLKKWKEKYPSTKLVNMFGITETTIHVTYKEIGETEIESNTSNIGRPLPTLSTYIMDRNLNLQPIGIPGELCIAGEGVARGYLNNPELTSERFIYHRSYQSHKSYISYLSYFYRSGDLTRWLSSGDMEYLGRIDHQVKIRGFRMELGEIETLLVSHQEIKDAVVIVSRQKQDHPYLCAYFAADRNLADSELRDYLSKYVPDYMIPSYFVQLDKIPLTFNGKVDKKALPEPGLKVKDSYAAPRDEIERKLVEIWAELLGRDASHASQLRTSIGIDDNYFEIGGNSLSIIAVNKRINQVFEKEVAVIDLFRFTTIRSLAQFLQQQEVNENYCPVLPPAARGALFEKTAPLDPLQKLLVSFHIAVIGMAGRFPGAKDICEFWENLKNGVECTWFFNDRELQAAGVEPHLLKDPGYVHSNAILEEIEYFDPGFFGYSPREAEIMDPQTRMFHECAWNALEDAGYSPDTYEGLIGLYAGAMYNFDWETRVRLSGKADVLGGFASWQLMNKDFLSMRVSYRLNLQGPAVFVQTSCSTSLTAVHMACQAVINGECDMALAGGVSVSSFEKTGYLYQEGMVLSPDGHCRAFDAKAAGAVAGNGLGIIVLKPLETAVRDGDHIYALVKGSAVNNDGIRKVGFTAPSIEGQAEVIIAAQEIAKVEPESITYVETHGTGTPLGDPVEIEALKLAFQRGSQSDKCGYCAVGSVKTNLGHLDTAAGITGFIKAVLAIYHRCIPPSLHYETPNPKIEFKNSPFYVNTRLKEWKRDGYPLRAGVSSFGMGGTNAHVVLEEFTAGTKGLAPLPVEGIPGQGRGGVSPPVQSRNYQLILLSAKTQTALDKMTGNLAEFFKNNHLNPGPNLADAAYTLQVGRKVFEHRRMLVCANHSEAVELLSSPGSGKVHSFSGQETRRPVIFMFAGQGSQYIDMGRDLYDTEPVFKEEMDRCFKIINSLVDYDIKEILYPSLNRSHRSHRSYKSYLSHISQTEIALPIIFIFEYALAKLLMNWGIKPRAMIGYSVGEYVPACLSGVFSLEAAINLIVLRCKLTGNIPGGAMLSVPLPEDQLLPLLDEELSLAVDNGPSCIVSGPNEAVMRLEQQLKKRKLIGMRLNISHAMHSSMMDPIMAQYESGLRQAALNPPRIPFISNVTGTWIKREQAADPVYWIKQMRQPVRFASGLKELLKENQAIFLEIGPGSDLGTILRQQLNTEAQHQPLILNTVRHPQQQVHDGYYLLNRIGRLWIYGTSIDWNAFHAGEKRKRISLPTYPYDRLAYRLEVETAPAQDLLTKEPGSLHRHGDINKELQDRGKKSDISDWFYIPGWKISPIPFQPSPETMESFNWLVLGDDTGLGRELVQKLQHQGQQVIWVTPGPGFASEKPGEYSGYTINPGEERHYWRLLETLASRGWFPHRIVHLWGMMEWDKGDATKNNEWYTRVREGVFNSLVYLTKAIGRQALDKKIQLTVVSSHMQGIYGSDLLYPEKALLLGPVRTIPREYPNITCRSIDFAPDEQIFQRLWQEIWYESSETIVAYRGIHRLIQTFDPFPLPASDDSTPGPRLRQRGIYLVTGGLGGIGLLLAEYLARAVRARLILTGRSPFPSKNDWDQWLEQHADEDTETHEPIGAKIKKLKELEEKGAEIMTFSADVSDLRQMKEVITAAEKQWGKINGIVHCAGIVQGGLIQQVTEQQVLDGFRSKVSGTLVLDALFKDTAADLDFFILCSSLNALLGVMGEVIYCAANAFLDAFALQKTSRGRIFTAAINWDAWQGVGFAREVEKRFANNKNLSQLVENVFKFGMLAGEGVEVFKRVLATDTPRLVISTIDFAERCNAAGALETSPVIDNFKAMNRSGNRYPRPVLSIPYAPPGNEIQQLICETWEKFLGIEQVGIHDNFFELGATSLGIVQVTALLKETLGKNIPVPTMYAYPTVKELDRYLRGDTMEKGPGPGEIAQLEAISKGKNKLKQRKQNLKENNLA